MRRIELCGEWLLSGGGIDGSITATVPGCVHTDLHREGIIPDPLYRDNNKALGWIEKGSYTYERGFVAAADPDAVLVFEGLDTYADIYLNGEWVGESHNMFIPHR